MNMTIIKAVRFFEIQDDEWIYFTTGYHRRTSFRFCFSVREIRKHIDMSIPVFYITPLYRLGESTTSHEWLFTISTKDYEDLSARKDLFKYV